MTVAWALPLQHQIGSFYRKYKFPILLTIQLRLILSFWMMVIGLVIDRYFPIDGAILQPAYGILQPEKTLLGRALLDVWLRWDAVHYMNIAVKGYSGVGVGDYNYAPLYPYLTLALKWFTFSNTTIAGLLISTLSTLIALVLLYKLVYELFHDLNLARNTVLLYGLYPTSFFLFAPYTDALFLCLTIAFFLLLYQRKWLLAGIFVSLASLTRIQGLILCMPFILELFRTGHLSRTKLSLQVILGLAIAPIGFVLFYLWRATQAVASISDSFSQYSQIVFIDPLSGILLAIRQFLETGSGLVLAELLSLLLFCAVTGWMIGNKQFRAQPSLLVYSASLLILFLSKHSYTASAMQSSARYVLSVFPVFIGFAKQLENLSPRGQKILILTSSILLLIASTLYALWIFVG